MNYKHFETERLIVRPTSLEDADFILELLNTQSWIEYIRDRNVKSIEEAENYIKIKMMPQLERLGYSNYTVIEKEGNNKIGTVGLYDREGFEEIDIGFALLPTYEKKGYAYEASNRIKEAAFYEFGIKALCAITSENNLSSQTLLKKLGLKEVGTKKLPKSNEELLLYRVEKQ
ncbi:MAG: GNAT family N-acetyltransferase [Bacteroidetes bacterium]|jgi:RimJ/RimL family protein N-acetyltransferase|nr:GNAT family N-acetyltransferase [Bacteroidota bacterium]